LDTYARILTHLSRGGAKRKTSSRVGKRRSSASDPPGEGGPDEAASFIAETLANLARLALRHRLDHLRYLLAVAQMEAEEHLRRRRLS
jgi:hypothetical protein